MSLSTAKAPIKQEVKEENSASNKEDVKSEPRQDATPASVKEEPPDDGLRQEAGKEGEDEGIATSQELEAAVTIETKKESKAAAVKGETEEGRDIVKGKIGKHRESATVKTDDERISSEIHVANGVAALSSCDDKKNVVLRAADKKQDKGGSCDSPSTEKDITNVEIDPRANDISLSSGKDTSVDGNRMNDHPSDKLGDSLSRDDSSDAKPKDSSEKCESGLKSEGRSQGNCAENRVSKNKYDDRETSQRKCSASVKQEKHDDKVEKQDSVEEKEDCVEEKAGNVHEKQDDVQETQNDVRARSDSGSAKPDARESSENAGNAHDVSHAAGDTSDGETTERLTAKGTASSNVCEGESREETGKYREEGENTDGRLPHMRKRLRRSKHGLWLSLFT